MASSLVEYSVDSILSPNIKICQPITGFRFSIDSILLAKFVKNKEFESILDIGTGSGVLCAILVNLNKCKKVDAVEVDSDLYECLLKTIKLNKLDDKVNPFNQDIRLFKPKHFYDMVICNPPYRNKASGRISSNNMLKKAKTNDTLTLEDIMKFCKSYLKYSGYLYLSYKPALLVDLIEVARRYRIEPKRMMFFYPDNNKNSNIVFIECQKMSGKEIKIEPPVFQYINNVPAKQFKDILKI